MAERISSPTAGGSMGPDATATGGHSPGADEPAKGNQARPEGANDDTTMHSQGRRAAREVRERAGAGIDRGMDATATRIEAVVAAMHSAADRLEDEGERWFARYARRAAGQVERVRGYLEEEDASTLLSDLENAARENPGTFLGTTFASGVAVGRFLRSSEPRHDGAERRTHASPAPRPAAAVTPATEPGTPPLPGGSPSTFDTPTHQRGRL